VSDRSDRLVAMDNRFFCRSICASKGKAKPESISTAEIYVVHTNLKNHCIISYEKLDRIKVSINITFTQGMIMSKKIPCLDYILIGTFQ
jgi:hypothetical protein